MAIFACARVEKVHPSYRRRWSQMLRFVSTSRVLDGRIPLPPPPSIDFRWSRGVVHSLTSSRRLFNERLPASQPLSPRASSLPGAEQKSWQEGDRASGVGGGGVGRVRKRERKGREVVSCRTLDEAHARCEAARAFTRGKQEAVRCGYQEDTPHGPVPCVSSGPGGFEGGYRRVHGAGQAVIFRRCGAASVGVVGGRP